MRPLRTVIVAGGSAGEADAALDSAADAVAVDLAGPADVEAARKAAASTIGRAAEAGKPALAIVNHPRTRLLRDDIDAVVSSGLRAVIINCLEPQDVRDTAV